MKITILKHYPFCDGQANCYSYDPYDGYQGDCERYRVRCTDCGAMIEAKTEDKAVALWNERAVQKVQKF
jgi:hypothetical protein